MSEVAYSAMKAAWHTDAIGQMRMGKRIAPRQVHFVISDLCNHDCHFCAYRSSAGFSSANFGEETNGDVNMNPNRRIPTEKAMEIIEDMAMIGVRAVQFTGGGEPTVHKDHLKIFAHAQSLGLETSLVTNGQILADGWEDVYSKMAWIRVSVDAGDADTYSRVRRVRPRVFDKVWDNVESICKVVDHDKTLFGVGYVVTLENHMGLGQAVMIAANAGVPYVRVSAMFSTVGAEYYGYSMRDEISQQVEHLARISDGSDGRTTVVNLFSDRIDDLQQHSPDYEFCGYQQFVIYIGGNQKVYRCCTTAFTDRGEIGDLTESGFYEWFKTHDAYTGFDARGCNVCQFNDKNKAINYLLQPKPLHVNFV